MRASVPYQYFPDVKADAAAIDALWGGPKYITLFNAAAAAWVPGSWYMVDLTTTDVATDYGLPAAAIIAAQHGVLCLGVAVDAPATGEKGRIQVFGKYSGANVATSTAVGAPLSISSTAGRAEAQGNVTAAAAYRESIGICLTLAASNAADVFIFNRFGL